MTSKTSIFSRRRAILRLNLMRKALGQSEAKIVLRNGKSLEIDSAGLSAHAHLNLHKATIALAELIFSIPALDHANSSLALIFKPYSSWATIDGIQLGGNAGRESELVTRLADTLEALAQIPREPGDWRSFVHLRPIRAVSPQQAFLKLMIIQHPEAAHRLLCQQGSALYAVP